MDSVIFIGLAASIVAGLYAAYLYGRKTKQFLWRQYVALVSMPIAACCALSYFYGNKIITLFIASAFVGTLLECGIGLAYHKTLNKRLWTYSRLSINGYTSLLSVPLWGVAGIIFWLLGKSIGLQ